MKLREEIIKKRSSRLHLHDLILIVKCLYPHWEIENPYEELIYIQASWTTEEKELVNQLLYVSVLLNKCHRIGGERPWTLKASYEDYTNALSMAERELHPVAPLLLLSTATRRYLIALWGDYGEEGFTLREAQFTTHMSKTSSYRRIKELESKGMVERMRGYKGQGHQYRISSKLLLKLNENR